MIKVYERKQVIYPSLGDASGKLSYYDAFDLFMDIASEHAEALGVGIANMTKMGIFWLTVKTKIDFIRRPRIGEAVVMHTWADDPENIRILRHYDMLGEDGEVLVAGKTDWAVLNFKTNQLVNIADFYPESVSAGKEPACTGRFVRITNDFADIEPFSEYRVRSTDIDFGGHMNNTAYVKALIGCFSNAELKEMNIKGIDIIFRKPCYEGDLLQFKKDQTDGGLEIKAAKGDETIILANIH